MPLVCRSLGFCMPWLILLQCKKAVFRIMVISHQETSELCLHMPLNEMEVYSTCDVSDKVKA